MLARLTFVLLLAVSSASCAGTPKTGSASGGGATAAADGSGAADATGSGASGATDGGGGATGSGGRTGTGGVTESGGGTSGGGSGASAGTGGTSASSNCPAEVDLGVRLVGRYDGCATGPIRQAWSGTGFVARFEGTGLTIDQDGPSIEYTVVVDGVVEPKVVTQSGRFETPIVTNLSPGEHTVELYRRSEASFGTTALHAVEVTDGSLLAPPPAPARLIEIVGDSITCGYGNEGPDTSCGFSADTENHYMAYGSILARSFGAELSTVAWSGRGVVSNYAGEAGPTLPDLYERAVPSDEGSVWTFAPKPALVIINLGTNDYSTDHDPATPVFVAAYEELLATIRTHYPDAAILCTVGPLLSGSDRDTARANIESAVAARVALGDQRVRAVPMNTPNQNPGCDWHPSIPTHTAMADELEPVVVEMLGW